MGLLLPYLITKHLQEWFFIFVLKSLARTAQRYENSPTYGWISEE